MKTILLIILVLMLVRIGCDRIRNAEDTRQSVTQGEDTTFVVDPETGRLVRVARDTVVQPPNAAAPRPAIEVEARKPAAQSPVTEKCEQETGTSDRFARDTMVYAPIPAAQKTATESNVTRPPEVGVSADLPETSIPGKKVKMRLRTNWLAEKLNYVFQVYPYDSFAKYYSGNTGNPADANSKVGFEIMLTDSKSVVVHRVFIDFWTMTAVRDEQDERIMLRASSQIDCTLEEFERLAFYSVTCKLDLDAIPSISFEEEMNDKIAQMPEMYGNYYPDGRSTLPITAKYWVEAGDGIKHYFSTREELEKIFSGLIK